MGSKPRVELTGAVGAMRRLAAQGQALRGRAFDDQARRLLDEQPEGTVVALGEGLETQFWRVDNGRVRWVTVDLPEVVALRERLLPAGPRQRTIARSVLDERWLAEVPADGGVLVTAQGLLMYLQPAEVRRLIAGCARRFPGGAMLFDAVPRRFSERTLRGTMTTPQGYRPPPMPWGMDPDEIGRLPSRPGRSCSPASTTARRARPLNLRNEEVNAACPDPGPCSTAALPWSDLGLPFT